MIGLNRVYLGQSLGEMSLIAYLGSLLGCCYGGMKTAIFPARVSWNKSWEEEERKIAKIFDNTN